MAHQSYTLERVFLDELEQLPPAVVIIPIEDYIAQQLAALGLAPVAQEVEADDEQA